MEMALASGSGWSDRFVTVHLGHAKTTDRILLEIHLDQDGGFVATTHASWPGAIATTCGDASSCAQPSAY